MRGSASDKASRVVVLKYISLPESKVGQNGFKSVAGLSFGSHFRAKPSKDPANEVRAETECCPFQIDPWYHAVSMPCVASP
jgi:hypothetical protein